MKDRPAKSRPRRQREKGRSDVTLVRELRAVFNDVHQHGERALKEHDYETFGDAIAVERSLIHEQGEVIRARIDEVKRRRSKRSSSSKNS